jgi:DNA topoisomerase-1
MAPYLVIVESPGKIKKIGAILGKDYHVAASVGHIQDLDKKGLSIDVKDNFKPTYVINSDKKKVVSNLKEAMKGKTIYLASDEDREGEFISYSLFSVLKPKQYHRITFNEITKTAIMNAIHKPRDIDYDLVNAQQCRRLLDRLVGYKVSPVLFNKFPGKSLAAGRVQSPIVRLIVDTEDAIQRYFEDSCESHYEGVGTFLLDDKHLECVLYDEDDEKFLVDNKEDAIKLMKSLVTKTWSIGGVQKKDTQRHPSAPFTTSTLQQAASSKLHYNVKRTMQVAQKLYEAGHITYMRTDSVTLSEDAHKMIKDYVTEEYGKEYYKHKQYTSKAKNAQEAHEAIRPTYIDKVSIKDMDEEHNKLYQLIWKKTVSSQMSPAKIEQTTIKIVPNKQTYYYRGILNRLIFDGFLKVYRDVEDQDEDYSVIHFDNIKRVTVKELMMRETIQHPPTRFNEASLVKELEKIGIGRPSTYANMISKIQDHGYVEIKNTEGKEKQLYDIVYNGEKIKEKERKVSLGKENKRLVPTELGIMVTRFLMEHFPDIMDYQFTAQLEEQLDDIAEGKAVWHQVLHAFNQVLDSTLSKLPITKTIKGNSNDEELGDNIYYVKTKFGTAIKKTIDGKDVFVSVKEKPSLEQAQELIEGKNKSVIKVIDKYTIKNGEYGPYIQVKVGKGIKFFSVKGKDPEKLTKEECAKICEAKKNKK